MNVVKGPDNAREQELKRLVDAYQTSLLRMCHIHLQDGALAEDAVQETFLKAYRALSSFKNEGSEKAWLMKIAINTCRDIRRSSWYKYVNRWVSPDDLPEEASRGDVSNEELSSAILKLPTKQREVIMLFYYQNMKLADIAGILGIPLSTVSGRLGRARKKLKALLERSDQDD